MAYSLDLRLKVIEAYDRGMKTKPIAQLFGVSPAWARRLKQRRRVRGTIEPLPPSGGVKPILGGDDHAKIHAHFKTQPDTTIAALKEALGTEASEVTVWRAARSLGYRFKKSRSTRPSVSGPTSSSGVTCGPTTPKTSTPPG